MNGGSQAESAGKHRRLTTLKRRSDFLRVRGGVRCSRPSFVLEAKPRDSAAGNVRGGRVGFTVSKQMGNAVQRNRIKRRLKGAVRGLLSSLPETSLDYVLVARRSAADIPYQDLMAQLQSAFATVHRAASKSVAAKPG